MMANYCITCIKNKKFNRAIGEERRELVDVDIFKAIQMPRKHNRTQLANEFQKINRI
jgi:hypothetical protein